MRIGVLDDDITTLQMIEQSLKGGANVLQDPECLFFTRGMDMLDAVKKEAFDCLILDRQLPDMNGDVILQWVRQYSLAKFGKYTTVLMLTHLRSEADELYGLQSGADDYLTKPFRSAILVQRVQRLHEMRRVLTAPAAGSLSTAAHLRRGSIPEPQGSFEAFGYVFSSFHRSTVLPTGEEVILSRMEADLARYFFQNPGIRLSRESIVDNLWHNDNKDGKNTRALDTHVHKLRTKLKLLPEFGFDLRTIYGFGYCLYVAGK